MRRGSKRKKVFAEINITPLTDVFLVLLVVVIIAAPALDNLRGEIATPEIGAAAALDSSMFVVEVDRDGVAFVDGRVVPEVELLPMFQSRLPSLDQKKIVIRGDEASKSSTVLRVLKLAQEAGFEKGFILGQVPQQPDGTDR